MRRCDRDENWCSGFLFLSNNNNKKPLRHSDDDDDVSNLLKSFWARSDEPFLHNQQHTYARGHMWQPFNAECSYTRRSITVSVEFRARGNLFFRLKPSRFVPARVLPQLVCNGKTGNRNPRRSRLDDLLTSDALGEELSELGSFEWKNEPKKNDQTFDEIQVKCGL